SAALARASAAAWTSSFAASSSLLTLLWNAFTVEPAEAALDRWPNAVPGSPSPSSWLALLYPSVSPATFLASEAIASGSNWRLMIVVPSVRGARDDRPGACGSAWRVYGVAAASVGLCRKCAHGWAVVHH